MEAQQVAVVILNWNGEKHLSEFLPSVCTYTPDWVDVIVADNGSTDGSLALLRTPDFARVKVIELDRNYGFAEGYNRALEQLDYKYAVLLNSDVAVTKGWCEPLFEALEADESLAAVSPKLRSYLSPDDFEYAGASGGYLDYLGYPFCRGRILQCVEKDEGQYDDAKDVMWVSGAAFVCRLSVYKQLGGFAGDFFAHMEEIDLCWRFALAGYRVSVIPQSVVYHLGGGTLNVSSPRKTFLNHRNNLAMLFRCASTKQRFVVALVRPVLDMAAAVSYLLKGEWGNFKEVIKAYKEFIAWHPRLQRQRHAIQSSKVSNPKGIIYRGSIILRYILKSRKFGDISI